MGIEPEKSVADDWGLEPLMPTYIANAHGSYVKAIIEGLDNSKIRNIALSGSYGVGKSSILQEVSKLLKLKKEKPIRKCRRIVELSLSTLWPMIDKASAGSQASAQVMTLTNRIQQEIVKQLLYRQESKKAPLSRFRRIERFNWFRELGLALLGGIVAALIFMVFGGGETINMVFGGGKTINMVFGGGKTINMVFGGGKTINATVFDFGFYIYLLLVFLITVIIYAARALLHGRVHIKQFSVGPTSVTLDEKSVSYFDQYLDEIVYFFETSKCDVVIFEDIDRFDDSHIFDTLRSLNTLLNASPQIKAPIRFIYAIKDSIFDRSNPEDDPAAAEAVCVNRTKFFDLIIPVVPFITHHSARDLMTQLLGEIEHEVSADLIKLAGRYVPPDMRLLKNVRNEFVVFRDQIFSGAGEELKLEETKLFAMMLFKSTRLKDFEDIRLGRSSLNKLYDLSRKLVEENIDTLVRGAEKPVPRPGVTGVVGYSEDERVEHLEFLRSADMGDLMKRSEFKVEYEGEQLSLEVLAEKLLTRGLAFQLIREGHIDRNFMLYTSTFHGNTLSAAATNFINLHVDRNVMDPHFQLTDKDVDMVVEEVGLEALSKPALFNIAILDHLLLADEPAAATATMVKALSRLDEDAKRFLQAYLSSGKEQKLLLEALTPQTPDVLAYLISGVELDDARRLDLVSHALASLAEYTIYTVNEAISKFLASNYLNIQSLTSEKIDSYAATRIATIFAAAKKVRVAELKPLGATICSAFIESDLYEVNLANLQFLVDQGYGIDCSAIKKAIAESGESPESFVAFLKPHLKSIADTDLLDILKLLGDTFAQLYTVGHDKPKIRSTAGVVELLEHLRTLKIVNSFSEKSNLITVNKKHK